MVVGITLGVAVVVGVDMANGSASQAFDLSTQAITGRSTHYISAGSQGLDEEIYFDLRGRGPGVKSTPIISDYVTSPQLGGVTLQLLGVDPFTERPFRDYLQVDDNVPVIELTKFLTEPGGCSCRKTWLSGMIWGLILRSKLNMPVGFRQGK